MAVAAAVVGSPARIVKALNLRVSKKTGLMKYRPGPRTSSWMPLYSSFFSGGTTTRSPGSGFPNLLMTTSTSSCATYTRVTPHFHISHSPYSRHRNPTAPMMMVRTRFIPAPPRPALPGWKAVAVS